MSRYAQNTNVSIESSQQEVQKILRKYGADELKLVIEGTVNKNGKTDITNKYLIGEIVEEYVKSF